MKKELFEKYAKLKIQAKELDAEIKGLNPLVKQEMLKAEKDEVELESVGKFSFKETRIWTYPDEIVKMEKALEEEKTKAKRTGAAKSDVRQDLLFTPQKDEQTD